MCLKRITFCILSQFLFFISVKAVVVDGFYVGNHGDTIKTRFNISTSAGQPDLFKLYSRVEMVTDSGSRKTIFKPGDIESFGFTYKEKNWTFVSKKIGEKSEFFSPEIDGKKNNLYSQLYATGGGQLSYTAVKYFITKEDSIFLILPSADRLKKNKEKLMGFFTDVEIQKQIQARFNEPDDIEKDVLFIVNYANGK